MARFHSNIRKYILCFFLSLYSLTLFAINVAVIDSSLKYKAERVVELGEEAIKGSRHQEAKEYFRQALDLYQQVGDSVNVAAMYKEIAGCIVRMNGDYNEAIQNYNKAIDLFLKLDGYELEELNCLAGIKKIYLSVGKMEEYSKISDDISKKITLIPDTPERYEFLANEKQEEKDYEAAIGYYQKAKELLEQNNPIRDIHYYLTICYNLSVCLYSSNHFEDALTMVNHLYEVEREYGVETIAMSEIARTQIRSLCLQKLGRVSELPELIDQEAERLKNNTSSFIRSSPYQNAMMIFNNLHDYKNVLLYASKADSVMSVDLPETELSRLSALTYKITAFYNLDNYAEAIRLYNHKISIKQDIYKNNPAEYIQDIYNIAQIEAFSGVSGNAEDLNNAKKHITEYARLEEESIKQQAPWLTSIEKNALWEKAQNTLATITGFAGGLKAFNEQLDIEVYNAHLLSSGLLLKTEKSVTDAILKYGTNEDKKQLDDLSNLKDSLSEAIRQNDMKKKADYQIAIQSNESELLKKASRMPNCKSLLDVDYSAIHSALKPGEVLVDFLQYTTQSNNNRINAFVIRPEWEFPQLLRLYTDDEIYAISKSLDAKMYEDSVSAKMRTLLLDSILTYIKPGEHLYYVPDGVLHGVSLENLISDNGTPLSGMYDIHRLSSATSLLEKGSEKIPNTAVLYGGLNYGDYKSGTDTPQTAAIMPDGEERGVGDAFQTLAGTSAEVKNIKSTLKKSKINAICYEKDNGTEETFLALDGKSPDIIHLATHGYYLSPERAKKVTGLAGYTDAMRLSGLVMAGGNAGWLGIKPQNGTMNGLLSAEDISKLDLSQTKLVVLSACKTASGQTSPEGIFGLQRAFKKAGAGTIVMTLWGINDKVTSEFMTIFYRELLTNKWNKHEAFKITRNKIKEQYVEPYYWAGFIMLD